VSSEPADEPVPILGDQVLLRQMLLNLILNARDAMPGGGRVRVAALAGGGGVRLVVRDTGPGLPAALVGGAFESGISGKGSTGMGLAFCARIAHAHGGSLDAANDPAGGAVITFRAPAGQPAKAEPEMGQDIVEVP
jgi:signal transduction histidine kinase